MRAILRPTAPISSGEPLGRYDLSLPIASGGMATVYLARTRGLGGFERDVAIKLMHPHLREHEEFSLDLIEEAKLSAQIRHPNVVPVLDVASDHVGVYLVMEYIEGTSLSGLVKAGRSSNRPVPVRVALRIVMDMLAGLHAAHELEDEAGRPLGLVHRDVSPQNVLVGLDGIARLTDFGIAKAASRISHTRTGTTKGKLAYMAPEQANAQALDRRCDVWAAAVTIWELVAERRLFSGTEAAIVLDIVSGKMPKLRELRPEVPEALAAAIESALTVPVQSRCPTAAELRERIARACSGEFSLADHAEVAEYVTLVCGEQLRQRRAQARSIAARRGPLEELPEDAIELSLTAADPSWLVLEPKTAQAAARPEPSESAPAFRRRLWPMFAVALAVGSLAALALARVVSDPEPEAVRPAAPARELGQAPTIEPAEPAALRGPEPAAPPATSASNAPPAPKPRAATRRTAAPRTAAPFRNPYDD